MRVAVLASGRGSNLESLLRATADGRVDAHVALVVSDRPHAPCLEKARAAGVPAILTLSPEPGEDAATYDGRLRAALDQEGPDLVVLAGFMRILSAEFCDAFEGRLINIHPALLPAFRGAHGVRDTLAAGARLAGCTTHFVTPDLDAGPIILQAALAVREGEDRAALARRVLRLEHDILPRTVQLIAEGRVRLEDGRVGITPGPSWSRRREPDALYPEAY